MRSEPLRDDELYRATGALVDAGEYRDQLNGVPGTRLEGGGAFRLNSDGSRSRIYRRGSREHLEAKAAGLVERLPLLRPASEARLAQVEQMLGQPLPPLLRRLYLGLGNGGFGPGYGLLRFGPGDEQLEDAVDLFRNWKRPKVSLLPICHWGCGIYSLIDLSGPPWLMWACDPNGPHEELSYAREEVPFSVWLARWMTGELRQPAIVQDEATGVWRLATEEDWRDGFEDSEA